MVEVPGSQKLLMDFIEHRYAYDGKSTSVSKRREFKPLLCQTYLKIFGPSAQIMCQVLGINFYSFLVAGAHIFKHEWAADTDFLLGFEKINNPRNGLLLLMPIQKALDRSRLCFTMTDGRYRITILDPNLRDVELFDACLPFITKSECEKVPGGSVSVDDVISATRESLTVNGRLLTFRDLEGNPITCKDGTTPFRRCLNFHAVRAHATAVKNGWISEDLKFAYSWSQDFDESKLARHLSQLPTSFEALDIKKHPDAIPFEVKEPEDAPDISAYLDTIDDIRPEDAVDEEDSDGDSEDE
jgi:hypothetical protein